MDSNKYKSFLKNHFQEKLLSRIESYTFNWVVFTTLFYILCLILLFYKCFYQNVYPKSYFHKDMLACKISESMFGTFLSDSCLYCCLRSCHSPESDDAVLVLLTWNSVIILPRFNIIIYRNIYYSNITSECGDVPLVCCMWRWSLGVLYVEMVLWCVVCGDGPLVCCMWRWSLGVLYVEMIPWCVVCGDGPLVCCMWRWSLGVLYVEIIPWCVVCRNGPMVCCMWRWSLCVEQGRCPLKRKLTFSLAPAEIQHTQTHTCIHAHTRTRTHTHRHIHAHRRTLTYAHIHTNHTHAHACTHTHTRRHMQTHTPPVC